MKRIEILSNKQLEFRNIKNLNYILKKVNVISKKVQHALIPAIELEGKYASEERTYLSNLLEYKSRLWKLVKTKALRLR